MVMYCLACRRPSSRRVTLFKFPQDIELAHHWAAFCNIQIEELRPSSRVCSLHFTEDNYKFPLLDGRKVSLRDGAVPTIAVVRNDTSEGLDDRRKYRRTPGTGRKPHPPKCCLCGLLTVLSYNNSISTFRFPKNTARRAEWLRSLELSESDVKPWQRICCRHFKHGDPNGVPVRSAIYDLDETLISSVPGITVDNEPYIRLDKSGIFGEWIDSDTDPLAETNCLDSLLTSPRNSDSEFAGINHNDDDSETSSSDIEFFPYVPPASTPTVHAGDIEDIHHNNSEESVISTVDILSEPDVLATPTLNAFDTLEVTRDSSKRKLKHFKDSATQTRHKRKRLQRGKSQLSVYRKRLDKVYHANKRCNNKLVKLRDALSTLQSKGLISECASGTLKVPPYFLSLLFQLVRLLPDRRV